MKHSIYVILALLLAGCAGNSGNRVVEWEHLSSTTGALPEAGVGDQVATLIMDIDKDGKNDFVIAGWGKPSMVWFRRTDDGWTKYLIEQGASGIPTRASGRTK